MVTLEMQRIEHATFGLQGIALIHYNTAASWFPEVMMIFLRKDLIITSPREGFTSFSCFV